MFLYGTKEYHSQGVIENIYPRLKGTYSYCICPSKFIHQSIVLAEPAPKFVVHRVATFAQSAINTDRIPQPNFKPISSAWAESKLDCGLRCVSDKACKMFTFAENTCTIYSEEIDQVTFESHHGSKVYYEKNYQPNLWKTTADNFCRLSHLGNIPQQVFLFIFLFVIFLFIFMPILKMHVFLICLFFYFLRPLILLRLYLFHE